MNLKSIDPLLDEFDAAIKEAENGLRFLKESRENLKRIQDHLAKVNGRALLDLDVSKCTQLDALILILKRAGERQSTGQLADDLIKFGYKTKNPKNLRSSVFSVMNKNKNIFFKVYPGVWELAEWRHIQREPDEAT